MNNSIINSLTNQQIQDLANYFAFLGNEMRKDLQIEPLTSANLEAIIEARAMMLTSYHLESILDEQHQ